MKKLISVAAFSLAMALMGCNDYEVSHGADWGVGRISHHSSYGSHGYIVGRMHSRQRSWRDYNHRRYGGKPGWNRHGGGHHGGRSRHIGRGGHHGGGHHGGHGGGHRFLAESFTQVLAQDPAPALTKEDIAIYRSIGQAFGISTQAATTLMETLNRAAVGDFGGLSGLGLNADSLKQAKRNNGRLSASELDKVSRKLGVSQHKADSLIQAVLNGR